MGKKSVKENKNRYPLARKELERISITVETLPFWTEKMLANGLIDAEIYNARKNK